MPLVAAGTLPVERNCGKPHGARTERTVCRDSCPADQLKTAAMQTLLWDPVNGIGLNLLRIGIDGTRGTPNIMGAAGYADGQACVKFSGSDCKLWAAPWSPPANMKDNNNVNNGGHLLAASYNS